MRLWTPQVTAPSFRVRSWRRLCSVPCTICMCVLAADAGETALRAGPCLGWTVALAPHMREEMAHPPRGSRERGLGSPGSPQSRIAMWTSKSREEGWGQMGCWLDFICTSRDFILGRPGPDGIRPFTTGKTPVHSGFRMAQLHFRELTNVCRDH